jgi:hypothetical protein
MEMKKYKVITLETELWEREYLVEASSKVEAHKNLLKGDVIECLDGETINSMVNVSEIEEVVK